MDATQIGKAMLVAAAVLAIAGVLFLVGSALGVGSLPGDLSFGKKNVRVYVPIASSIIVSVVATIVLNLLIRRR